MSALPHLGPTELADTVRAFGTAEVLRSIFDNQIFMRLAEAVQSHVSDMSQADVSASAAWSRRPHSSKLYVAAHTVQTGCMRPKCHPSRPRLLHRAMYTSTPHTFHTLWIPRRASTEPCPHPTLHTSRHHGEHGFPTRPRQHCTEPHSQYPIRRSTTCFACFEMYVLATTTWRLHSRTWRTLSARNARFSYVRAHTPTGAANKYLSQFHRADR